MFLIDDEHHILEQKNGRGPLFLKISVELVQWTKQLQCF